MRGKRHTNSPEVKETGITPADAGKTVHGIGIILTFKDHPRGCGENLLLNLDVIAPVGSPPRMRGKPFASTPDQVNARITPADAGKTITYGGIAVAT